MTAAEEQADLRNQALLRQRDLLDRGVGTSAAVETAELAASSASQSILSRRQALANAEARLDQAKTRLARVEIDLSDAQRRRDDTVIRAAFDGALTDVRTVNGGRVTANEVVARLIDPDALEVSFRVSTSQYAVLLNEAGQLQQAEVTATLEVSGVDLTASGQITRDSASVGEGQTGRLLFARLEDAAGFRPGDFVTVSITEPPLSQVALLPATAVDAGGTVLTVNAENRLEVAPAPILRRQGDNVIVDASAIAGQTIITERSPLLGAGILVSPIARDPEGRPITAEPEAPEMLTLDAERRAKLIAMVEGANRMPAEAKARILAQLEQDEVPAETVNRIESRFGG